MHTQTFARKLGMGALALSATLVTATLLQATIISTANAAEPEQAISLHGLDLKRPADVATLYVRIREAAKAVCGDGSTTGSRIPNAAQVRCIDATVNSTVATIDKSELSAYHRQAKAGSGDRSKAGA